MATLKEMLNELVRVDGVNMAIVVGRDGFVIDGVVTNGTMDMAAAGAIVSTGIGSSESMGRELGTGRMHQGMMEYSEGIITMSFLGSEAILAVVADTKANLGNIRYQVNKRSREMEKAL